MPRENFLLRWWRKRQRKLDVEILWAQLLDEAHNRENAKLAFRLHMNIDSAYRNMDNDEKQTFINQLP